MAWEQIKLSEREIWAQKLTGKLEGIIPLAEFWAVQLATWDADFVHQTIENALASAAQGAGVTTDIAKQRFVGKLTKMEGVAYTGSHHHAREGYARLEDFQAAETEMFLQLLMREWAPPGRIDFEQG